MKEPQAFRLAASTVARLQQEADRSGIPKPLLVEMALRVFLNNREDYRLREEHERRAGEQGR